MTLSRTGLSLSRIEGLLLAKQAKVALSSDLMLEMVRLPLFVSTERVWRSSTTMALSSATPWILAQEKVGGGNPVAKQGMVMVDPLRARTSMCCRDIRNMGGTTEGEREGGVSESEQEVAQVCAYLPLMLRS